MATTQPGGAYKVGDRIVDADGKETKKLSEKAAERAAANASTEPTELPEDFPSRDKLVAAGLTTTQAVSAKSDDELVALEGIGEASVKKIRAALK